ncbi:NADH-quinone oxidoreductase subunit M [Campylobacter sp. VicNov18]|uniref:NADH-quinone oxidoreductase subunit M n=1 Tax=Campylobacter bilis TaxID=2691918 RepID=UPI00130E2776|nr:NADH-quinone oxidoreductase subunit M [Campylobacter bilis]MPV63820.1 NADH-quinone oxidoreductase subunit M [Campylobacter hepaticus]MBM0637321.1 NADH-quinone oxidoreductase subunit M [Campylobacter bilis]MCC8278040.1 NADH-quinone oxidoreductase subunit M [Campylobacter bilis]MCC8299544.1 NADH-quinone oxidoreductase subunit M [Campylobacter bilis]MCC8300949.1 NADH-quinone oxidoreductase subunit M [Campylobacter bilis]
MLNYLIFFPLIAAFVVLLVKRGGVKVFSVVVSFMILVLNSEIFRDFLQGTSFDYNLSFKMFNFFNFHIGVDSIALVLMLLSSLMIFLSFLFLKIEQKALVSCIFFLEFAIMGLFSAKDGILFYIFWEFSLLPLLYIIGVYGKDFRSGIKFFIYAFAGSILMLVALIYQAYLNYQLLNIFTFDLEIWKNNASAVNFTEQLLLFGAFFIAFAIKAPLFPFHTWAPKLYANSPVLVSVMLVIFKMAPFGFLLFCLPLFPDASVFFMPLIAALCIVSIVYNALIAYKAKSIKELIAYSSISHLGVMILGIFSLNSLGISGAVFYMFAHGIVTGTLFLMAELLYQKYHTYDISFYHSLAKKAPLFSIFFTLILLSSISLPLSVSFVGEFLVLLGVAKLNLLYAFLAGFVIVLGVIYMFAVFRKMFFMQTQSVIEAFSLRFREIFVLACVVGVIFYLGLVPNTLLKPIQEDVDNLIKIMNIRAVEQNTLDFLSKLGETNVE